MNIGVIGLGLIGGSIAKAIKHNTSDTVLGYDIDKSAIYKAKLLEAIDLELTDERLEICDVIIVALYPRDTVEYIKENYGKFKKDVIIMDCCGVKSYVCDELMDFSKEKGFLFVGAHPMAGIERSGFDNSNHTMFQNASIVIVPPKDVKIETLEFLKKFWGALGFTNFEVTTAKHHDEMIAYTSQLAHIVSSAYIKSPTALEHFGFSAGSYKDMTRVARLNEKMWTELFLENKEALVNEIEIMIKNLSEYRDSIKEENYEKIFELLKDGKERKLLADRKELKE